MKILRDILNRLDQLNITHGLFAFMICFPLSCTEFYSHSIWVVCGYFYGRERRDHERQAGLDPHKDWYIGHWPFLWADNTRRDLFSSIIAAFMPLPLHLWYFYG